MISWATVENAIVAWAKAASGFDQQHVIMANQGGPRPVGPFITLLLDGPASRGLDAVTHKYDAGAANGQQVVITATGPRELVARVSVFDGEPRGDSGSRAILSKLVSFLSLPGIRGALNAAGIGVASVGKINSLPAVRAAALEPRATVDVTLLLIESVEERTTWIEKVRLTQVNPQTLATEWTKVVP